MSATIPREAVDFLTSEINGISAETQAAVMRVLDSIEWTPDNIAECRAIVVDALALIMPGATTAAAQAAADFYDATREMAIGEALGAQAISGYNAAATEGAVRAFVDSVVKNDDIEQFNNSVLQRIDYELKLAAANSSIANGRRDPKKPRFARVPSGAETCLFCLMLASRGFVYHTESTAFMNHVHSDCDCRIIPGWDGMEVEGYDADGLYEKWRDGVEGMARDRAERKGTSYTDELKHIEKQYADAAKRSKSRKDGGSLGDGSAISKASSIKPLKTEPPSVEFNEASLLAHFADAKTEDELIKLYAEAERSIVAEIKRLKQQHGSMEAFWASEDSEEISKLRRRLKQNTTASSRGC